MPEKTITRGKKPRFEIESKLTQEASEEKFDEYTAWLRDSETLEVYVFTGTTRDSVKQQAIAKADEIKPPLNFSFVCGPNQLAG